MRGPLAPDTLKQAPDKGSVTGEGRQATLGAHQGARGKKFPRMLFSF